MLTNASARGNKAAKEMDAAAKEKQSPAAKEMDAAANEKQSPAANEMDAAEIEAPNLEYMELESSDHNVVPKLYNLVDNKSKKTIFVGKQVDAASNSFKIVNCFMNNALKWARYDASQHQIGKMVTWNRKFTRMTKSKPRQPRHFLPLNSTANLEQASSSCHSILPPAPSSSPKIYSHELHEATNYRCLNNHGEFVGIVTCYPEQKMCHNSSVNESEVVVEVLSVENGADPGHEEFFVGTFLKWSRNCLESVKGNGHGKVTKEREDEMPEVPVANLEKASSYLLSVTQPEASSAQGNTPLKATTYRCLNKHRTFLGMVKCHPDQEICNDSPVNYDNEVVIEVLNVENGVDAGNTDFVVGKFLKWSRICLDDVQEKSAGKQKKGRGRKRISNPDSWSRNEAKRKREMGEEYVSQGKKKTVMPAKQFVMNICDPKNCKRDCSKVTEEERLQLFSGYMKADRDEKNNILLRNAKQVKKRRVTNLLAPSRREFTNEYTLNGVQVCQKTFVHTFAIDPHRINRLLKKRGSKKPCGSGNYLHKTTAFTPVVMEAIHDVIEALPKYNCHYTDTSREGDNVVYVSPTTTMQSIYELVSEKIGEGVKKPNYQTFCKHFSRTYPHVKVKAMSTDKCNYCDDNTKTPEEKQLHQEQQKEALLQHKIDQDLPITYTFDMQSTMPLPKVENNLAFYKRQLWLYNEGVHHHTDNTAVMFLWLESEGGKGSHEICSVLYQHMLLPETQEIIKEHGRLIYWCDSTVSQNRNSIVAWFLSWAVQNVDGLKSVTVNFFVTGHSFNAGDRDFGLIKKKIAKVDTIFTPDAYIKIIKDARKKPSPFKVFRMSRDKLKDFTTASIKPDIEFVKVDKIKGTVVGEDELKKIDWFYIRSIEATDDVAGYKVRYGFGEADSEVVVDFQLLKTRSRGSDRQKGTVSTPKLAYPKGKSITKGKYDDIQELMKFVPPVNHAFYGSLKH